MPRRVLWGFLLVSGWLSTPAYCSLVFNSSFTANFNTNFGANAAAAQSSFNAATAIFSNLFIDDITINLVVDAVPGTGTLGSSNTSIFTAASYGTLYDAALADASSPDDATTTGSGGSLGGNGSPGSASDPVATSHNWWLTRAQVKALNLAIGGITANDSVNDGTITFGAGYSYSFAGATGPGTYDFIGIAAHEISEVMGRVGLSGDSISGSPGYTLVDALAFSAANTRVLNGGGGSFSLDAGTTLLKDFNSVSGGDTRDWASGTNDSFNAFSSSGVLNPVSAVDVRLMDVIGYDLAEIPEPGTLSLFAGGLALMIAVRRRRVPRSD